MRTTPSPISDGPPAPAPPLSHLATLVDQGSVGEPCHLLLRARLRHEEIELAVQPIDTHIHPFDALAGTRAPAGWTIAGVRAIGRARHLDRPGAPGRRSATTFLVSSTGEEASVMRCGDRAEPLPGPAEGTIPDACRRVLGVATPPAHCGPSPLFTMAWLDRVMADWNDPTRRRQLTSSWREVARRHPLVVATPAHGADLDDPKQLVEVVLDLTESWTWGRLRRTPSVVPLPEGDLRPFVTRWMDDGFYARWALGAFPPVHQLTTDLPALLGPDLGPTLVACASRLLDDSGLHEPGAGDPGLPRASDQP